MAARRPTPGLTYQHPSANKEYVKYPQKCTSIPEIILHLVYNNFVDKDTLAKFGDSSRTHAQRVKFIVRLLVQHSLIPEDLKPGKKGDEQAMIFQCAANHSLENRKPAEALYFFNKMVALVDYESVGAPMSFAF